MLLRRIFDHALYPKFRTKLLFPAQTLAELESAIQLTEQLHCAQLRFAIEGGLALHQLWAGISSRTRAFQLFSNLRVWDTAENCGVLIYLQLADRTVEIIADRGINAKVSEHFWQEIADQMIAHFKNDAFKQGSIWGIQAVSAELAKHFPKHSSNTDQNELPDRPVLI